MKRANLVPNIITAFGLACGLFVIFKVNMTGMGTYKLLHRMTLILLLAAVADLLDGAVARAMKGESEFGLVFDSLADAISFGVAPSVLLLKSLDLPQGEPISFLALSAAMVYTICGVLRLVRFNVKASQHKEDDVFKKSFLGLPITAASMCALAPNLFIHSPLFKKWFSLTQSTEVILLSITTFIIAYLMVSKLRFPSAKSIQFKRPTFNLIFFGTLFSCLVFYGLLYNLALLLLFFSWGYILVSLTLSSIRAIQGKRRG